MNSKIPKWISLFAIVLLMIATVALLQVNIDYNADARWGYREKVVYLPDAKYARFMTFGFDNVIADYLYLWSIQFFSEKNDIDRFARIENVFNYITELDPKYIEAYRIGSMIIVKDVYERHGIENGIDMAFRLYDKGIKNNPEDWLLPFEAANTANFDFKDPEKANEYYKIAYESPHIPEKYKQRLRTSIGSSMEKFNRVEALVYWIDLFQKAEDEVVRNIAYAHYYDLKIELDIEYIKKKILIFEQRHKVKPPRLSDLLKSGIARQLPRDPNNLPYLYDYKTGEVNPPQGFILKKKSSGK